MFVPFDLAAVVITPTLDTNIYASGDVLFVANKLDSMALNTKGGCKLKSLVVLDKINQKVAIDFLFFNEDPGNVGAFNAVLNLSSAQLAMLVGIVSVGSADYVTLKATVNAIAVVKPDLSMVCKQSLKDLWVVGVSRATPTFGINDLVIKAIVERQS